jgi:lipopolysaccharide/colanic/teichoic acid biosynthesis glycosyltransferase
MPQGYVSLVKKPAKPDPLVGSAEAPAHRRTASHANLHVVETERRSFDRFDVSPYLIPRSPSRGLYPFGKRVFDMVGAAAGIFVLSPLILVIVCCILSTGSSPIFRHRRVGRFGEFFDCLKFRTMVKDADQVLQRLLDSDRLVKEEWLRDHKLKNDPRITRIGRFLRKTSLDELPQLWNVLLGQMSLVGPRPVVPDELLRYGRKIPVYLSTRPGLTGLWQVSGRNEVSYRRRVALDVCYVKSRSVILDTYILIKTVPAVIAKSGAY